MKILVLLITLILIVSPANGAASIQAVTWAELMRTSDDFQQGFIVGMFLTASIKCPPTVTGAVIKSTMEGRVFNGLSLPSDSILKIFAQSAVALGCRYDNGT
jgi:hypothetical protein